MNKPTALNCQSKSQQLRLLINQNLEEKNFEGAEFNFKVLKKIDFPINATGHNIHRKQIKKIEKKVKDFVKTL